MSRDSRDRGGNNRTALIFVGAIIVGLGFALFSGSGAQFGTAVELQNVFCKVTNASAIKFAVCDNSNDTLTVEGGTGISVEVLDTADKIRINVTGVTTPDDEVTVQEAGSLVGSERKLNFDTASDFDVVDDSGSDRVNIGIANNAIGNAELNDNAVNNAEIATQTSTKITIIAKGQLNSAIVYNDQNNNLNSNLLTNLGTPTSTTDVQRVNRLVLGTSLVTSPCADGAPLEYQTSNSTWICGVDATGSGITSINGDSTSAQVFSGTTGNLTIADTGPGTLQWNLGSNVVVTGGSAQTVTKGLTLNALTLGGTANANGNVLDNIANINDNSGAEAGSGVLRVGNAVDAVCWEQAPAGADICLQVDATENYIFDSDINNIETNSNPIANPVLADSLDANNQIIINLGTPTASTDAQKVNRLVLGTNLVTSPCANGAPLEYQTSNSTWICGIDATGSGITDINGDATASQVFSGSSGNVTIGDTGPGTLQWNIGSNVVITGGASQTITKGLTTNALTLGGNQDANSNRIINLANPTASTDAQKANRLVVGTSLVTSPCANGAPLEYQTSNSTWICGTDTGITSINGDSTLAQTIVGVTGNTTASTSSGTTTINTAYNVLVTGGSAQTVTKGLTLNALTLGGNADANSNRIINLANPTSATDAQKANRLVVGTNLVTSPCADGAPLEYQTSNSTWICGVDSAGGSSNTITQGNSDVTVTDAGNGVVTVTVDGTQEFTLDTNLFDAIGATIDNVANINDNSGAEAGSGFIRVGNAVDAICWEQSPAGADICLQVDASEDFLFDTDINNINMNSNPITNADLTSSTNTFGAWEKMSNVTDNGCASGQVRKVSGTNWDCANDNAGVTSINSDTTASQSIVGVSGNTTASTSSGTTTINTGPNIVTTGGSAQTVTKGLTLNALTLGGNADANSNRIINLANPTASTDAQKANRLVVGTSLVTSPCADGAPLEYQTSNSTWICGVDGGGSSNIISQGDSNVEVIDAGNGQVDIDIDATNEFIFDTNLMNTLGATIDNVANINDNSGAEAGSGFIRIGNAVDAVCWEQAPAGADICIQVDASEDFIFDTDLNNINTNSNPIANPVLADSLDANSQVINNLGTPTATTDAQKVNRLVLGTSLVTSPCADGAPLEYQSSNSTWICGVDATGGGGSDIISEGNSNVEVIDTGTGQIDIDIDGTSEYRFFPTYFNMSNNFINFTDSTAPATPPANSIAMYADMLNGRSRLFSKDDAGNIDVLDGMPKPVFKKWGVYFPANTIAGDGFLNGATFDGTETITDDADGFRTNSATGTTAGNEAGTASPLFFHREWNAYFITKVAMVETTTNRVFIGFMTTATLPNTDTPCANVSCAGFVVDSNDSVISIVTNDGDATEDRVGSPTFTEDTNVHIYEVWAEASNNRFAFRFDGGTITYVTTEIPLATTDLGIVIEVETSDTTANNLKTYYLYAESDK